MLSESTPQVQFDYAIVNDALIKPAQRQLYNADGAYQLVLDRPTDRTPIDPRMEIVRANLLDDGEMVRHSSEQLARVVIACAAGDRSKQLARAEMLTTN